MIKVVDKQQVYYYDSPSDVWEDYPDVDIHGNIAIVKEQASA